MNLKLDINTLLTTCVLALATWIFTTVQRVDKTISVMEFRLNEMSNQTFHQDCPYCNHALHAAIPE